jgi:hypothetical protein
VQRVFFFFFFFFLFFFFFFFLFLRIEEQETRLTVQEHDDDVGEFVSKPGPVLAATGCPRSLQTPDSN